MQSTTDRDSDVVKLPCFQEKMMVKEDPIELKPKEEPNKRNRSSKNCVVVDRAVDRTQ